MRDRGEEIDSKQKYSVITAGLGQEAASAKERQDTPPAVQGKSLSATPRTSVSAGLTNDRASAEESVRRVWHRVLNAQQHPPCIYGGETAHAPCGAPRGQSCRAQVRIQGLWLVSRTGGATREGWKCPMAATDWRLRHRLLSFEGVRAGRQARASGLA